MLERGSAARYASSVFFENFNDFDIYVEDTAEGYSKLYAIILGRVLSSHVSIARVFPLGERAKVIEAASKALEIEVKRKSVFIVDGDLFLLGGEKQILPENAIRLPRYCIENFLADANSFHELLDEECPHLDKNILEEKFDFTGWRDSAVEPLRRLFTSFAVSHMLNTGAKTVSMGVKSICSNSMGEVCFDKSEKIAYEINKYAAEKCGDEEVNKSLKVVNENLDANCCFITTYVSGKDFILPLLFTRFRTISKSKTPNILLKQRLARKCDVEAFRPVVAQMERIVGRKNLGATEEQR